MSQRRIVIFGNAGSGKTSMAKALSERFGLDCLDLDEITWSSIGERRSIGESVIELSRFVAFHEAWIVEGCYGSLVSEAAKSASKLIFLNPGVEVCQANCRARPWEPHKYASKEEQDRRLAILLDWVAEYEIRDDEFSLSVHRAIFDAFSGEKEEVKSNEEARARLFEFDQTDSSKGHL